MNHTGCFGQSDVVFTSLFPSVGYMSSHLRNALLTVILIFVRILVRYTKKMPQVSSDTLLEIGKKMTAVGNKCCNLAEEKRMSCSEHYVSTWICSVPVLSWRPFLFAKILNSGEIANSDFSRTPFTSQNSKCSFSTGCESLNSSLMVACENFS